MKNNQFLTCGALAVLLLAASCYDKKSATAGRQLFDKSAMDSSVKPSDNFYLYMNGSWLKKTEIPPSESMIGGAMQLYNETQDKLHAILQEAAASNAAKGSPEQLAGDFFTSGMDTITIDKRGYEPIKPILAEIQNINDVAGIITYCSNQHAAGKEVLFGSAVAPDEKNTNINILNFSQGGLGLPDRDYYFKTDANTNAVVKAYKDYLVALFRLSGTDSVSANAKMQTAFGIEKQLAGYHKTNVELRDPIANYHKMAVVELDKSTPSFSWSSILKSWKVQPDSLNVNQPAFYEKLNGLLTSVPLADWKVYLQGMTLVNYANSLSSDFVKARFNYIKSLSGQQEIKPRWYRMVATTDAYLGDALGQLYVKKHFTPEAKKRMLELVNNLQVAFEARIRKLDWMSDSTKTKAIEKLHAFLKKIGYTDKWRDYSKVVIDKGKYFENRVSCDRNNFEYEINKVNKPVDRMEWLMSAPTINAYYNPPFNEIVFPAGMLQYPYFELSADDAFNYGAIGTVIGHEMTHGFDDQGALYDKDGNLKNWWSAEDGVKFKAKTKQMIDLYNGFTILDTVHVNGALTTGENIADFGGLNIAYDAFKLTKQGKDTVRIDGLTPDQRFFMSYAQSWRSKLKPELAIQFNNTDPHSPDIWRVVAPLMNFDPFYAAYQVKEGDKMYVAPEKRIKIW